MSEDNVLIFPKRRRVPSFYKDVRFGPTADDPITFPNRECLRQYLAEHRASALYEAADAIQALHPGEVKNSVIFLNERADSESAASLGDGQHE